MRILGRGNVNKSKSARSFRRNVGRTNIKNIKLRPMRGGIRL